MTLDELRELPADELERMRGHLQTPRRAFAGAPDAQAAYLRDVETALAERRGAPRR